MALHQGRSDQVVSTGRRNGHAELGTPGFPARHGKRAIDVILAGTGLLLLSPLILLVALAIRLDSPSSIFCREVLYGYDNRAIHAFKFRSTRNNARGNGSYLTWLGRVLRHTGIDELPQLLNVLLGEMSIVGPSAYARHRHLSSHHFTPLLAEFKPGLTGLAQLAVSRNGAIPLDQRIADDLYYIKNWSLLLDIKIIMATLLSKVPNT